METGEAVNKHSVTLHLCKAITMIIAFTPPTAQTLCSEVHDFAPCPECSLFRQTQAAASSVARFVCVKCVQLSGET